MMWFHGIGWGWAGCLPEALVMAVLWGAVIVAGILAGGFLTRRRSGPPALSDPAPARTGSMFWDSPRAEPEDNDQWYRRLM
ncbi:hypothetical protein MSG_01224 [Mycobacterium shigaense]|uniref:Uncharacterized protein n=1 Tax=Mycobacterium shigaense TaxID=722731 RepID=A0A1Z4EEI7_9MYCO|nr:hypothetical protein MSG_01224 [Mycobacterium shigaense]